MRSAITTPSPIVPPPTTSTFSPAAGGAASTAWREQASGSTSTAASSLSRIGDPVQLAGVRQHRLRPAAGKVAAIADQHPRRERAVGGVAAQGRQAVAAGRARIQAAHEAGDDRVDHHPLPGPTSSALPASSTTPTTSWPRMAGNEAKGDRIGLARPVSSEVSLPQIPASSGRMRTQSGPGQRRNRVSGERQPRHPAAGQRRQAPADEAQDPLVQPGRTDPQAQAASLPALHR